MNTMENLKLLARALEYMEDHLREELRTEDVASACFCSKSTLEKLFRYVNHLSVREYLIRRRMTLAARELWENPDLGIMDVALEYGYNSHEAFTRAFKQIWNCNPSEFRNARFTELFPRLRVPVEEGDEYMMSRRQVDISELFDLFQERKDCYFVCCDIKHMMSYNEISRKAGDLAILEQMRRMMEASGDEDVIFRIGGDEFCVLTASRERAHAEQIAERIIAENEKSFAYEDRQIPMSLYVTIAAVSGDSRSEELLANLQKAIRDCKTKEENRRMVVHKGWDWTNETSDSWLRISEEFLPIALQWKEKFHSVLDIGAGKGRHAFFFAENGFAVSAVDLSASSIEWIKRTAEESHITVDARVCDMTQLPYEDEAFDCVVCFHTIYHTDYMGMKKAVSEIERVLKKNGEAYITFNSKDNVKFNMQRSTDGFTMIPTEGKEAGIPHCYVDENDIKQLLGRFRIISLSKIQNYVRKERDVTGIHFFVHCKKSEIGI